MSRAFLIVLVGFLFGASDAGAQSTTQQITIVVDSDNHVATRAGVIRLDVTEEDNGFGGRAVHTISTRGQSKLTAAISTDHRAPARIWVSTEYLSSAHEVTTEPFEIDGDINAIFGQDLEIGYAARPSSAGTLCGTDCAEGSRGSAGISTVILTLTN